MNSVFLCLVVLAIGTQAQPPSCGPPPTNKNPMECCDAVDLSAMDPNMFGKCITDFAEQSKREMESFRAGGPHRGCCIIECAFNASGLDVNNVDGIKKMMFSLVKDAGSWKPIIDTELDACLAEAFSHKDEFLQTMALPPLQPGDRICNPKYGFMMMCMLKRLFTKCPANIFSPDAECAALKSYAETCPFIQDITPMLRK